MESFYGGRQGNPFIIVKRFDGIDIPQVEGHYVYKVKEYAYDIVNSNSGNDYYIFDSTTFKPIEKNSENQFDYTWKRLELNGQTIFNLGGLPYQLPTQLAEGMIQCFSQGGTTTSEVNYGEYVLIDTHTDLKRLNDRDNGMVYRRGMDYTNDIGGAEFIGNILGPQGECPTIDMDSYTYILNTIKGADKGSYSIESGDLVPGWDGEQFNDEIHYSWGELRDEYGEITTCLFGFKFPYSILELSATPTHPYVAEDENLITKVDDGQHPFYSKWHLSVPKGKHGADIKDLEVITTKAKKGSTYYLDPELTTIGGTLPQNTEDKLELQLGFDYNIESGYAQLYYNGNLVYVKIEDTWCTKLRYKEVDYENSADGQTSYVDLGPYNLIERLTVDEMGLVTVLYTYNNPEKLGQLSYVLETIVTKADNRYPIGEGHFLVLFSDFRGDITYYSEKYQKEISGYIDLGYVKGDPGPGLAIVAAYDSAAQLPTDPTTIPGYTHGAAILVDDKLLYIYDWLNKKWRYIGAAAGTTPEDIVKIDTIEQTEDDYVQNNGLWFVKESVKFVD